MIQDAQSTLNNRDSNYMNRLQEPFGLFNVSLSYSLLKISGKDVRKFLQGQLTCNVDQLTEFTGTLAAHCNVKGRIISSFYLFLMENEYYLFIRSDMISIILFHLKKYAIFYQIQFYDLSKQFIVFTYVAQNPLTFPCQFMITIDSNFQIIINKINSPFLDEASLSLYDHHEWRRYLIQHKIPTIYPETSGLFLPHDIHFDKLGGISFNKGCFTGQEIIARMHYLGKLKNHLYKTRLAHDIPLQHGADIYYLHHTHPRPIGKIVDYYHDNQNYYVLITCEENQAKTQHLFLKDYPQCFFEIID